MSTYMNITEPGVSTWAVIVYTQILENYGGKNHPWWKAKGGDAVWAMNIVVPKDAHIDNAVVLEHMPENVRSILESRDNNDYIETIVDIAVISTGEAEMRKNIGDDSEHYLSKIWEIRGGAQTYSIRTSG